MTVAAITAKNTTSNPAIQTELPLASDKIGSRHLDRLAVVYVRQSTMTQVLRNQESTKLQYSLAHLANRLGWSRERILVIDDDLGMSASTAIGREGFQRLLAEVALDHVGVILGVEMSRLARSNKDWHHLLELCARFGTLIADLDGLYDPSQYNDRLLLGLKGTMSEAELHILRQRLLQGKLQKARRGELGMPVPTGYLRKQSGEIVIDPDEEVQAVVRLVFEEFARFGSTQSVLRELVARKVQIGVRLRTGSDIGALAWHRPHRNMVAAILRNPIYAGAYVYGRRRVDPRRQKPGQRGSGRTPLLSAEAWHVCLRDRLPAYITWEQYTSNQERLMLNRTSSEGRGPVRNGSALLQGLIVCGRCMHHMTVQYSTRDGRTYPRYVCAYDHTHYRAPNCCGLSALTLDEVVTRMALSALAPGALEVSIRVADELERERHKLDELWGKRLERARYEAERAERQYQAVEPENRLVARTVERAWEEKLRAERQLQEQYDRERGERHHYLDAQERETIRALAMDLPKLWNAATTTTTDRKALLRLIIDKVTVNVDTESEWVDVVVQWTAGNQTSERFQRPVGKLQQLNGNEELVAEIHAMRRAGYTAERIAEKLNTEGWITPTQRNKFNARLIHAIMHRHGFVPRGPKASPTDNPNDWRLSDLSKELAMPLVTLYGWLRRGWLDVRREKSEWVITADRKEMQRLRRLRSEHSRQSN